ncbi:type II secretion system F family protein [Chromatiaceae bacterium AAb-1]|nr:type II secretion system F family protein [Chromatiaceae bacterium AAb-1]
MAKFLYKARNAEGKAISGEVEADSESAAADQLRRWQYIPLDISQKKESSFSVSNWLNWLPKSVNLDELIIFTRQMYSLSKAGIPIISAIKSLAESTRSSYFREVLNDIVQRLEQGNFLSVALAAHPGVFSRLVVSLVHVGENTGRLDTAFQQLSYYLEQEQETRKQIKQATRYPLFVMVAIVVAMFVLNILVIPQFSAMFSRFNAELPWSTRVLLSSSELFVSYWPLIALLLLALAAGFRYWAKTPAGRLQWSRLKLSMPIIGNIINRASLARFCRSFGIMLKAGLPMTTALSLVSDAIANDWLGDKITGMRRDIERGESLSVVAAQSKIFTALVLQMMVVGEETGQMDDMLMEVAGFYEREVAFDLKGLTAKIEPVLIGVVAVMVLILAQGIFTPMWDMLNAYKTGTG